MIKKQCFRLDLTIVGYFLTFLGPLLVKRGKPLRSKRQM